MAGLNVAFNKSKWRAKWRELLASHAVAPEVTFILWAGGRREVIEAAFKHMKQANAQAEWIVATDESNDMVVDEIAKVFRLPNGHSRYSAFSRAAEGAQGRTIVFLEANGAPDTETIRTFIRAIEQGADVALNPTVKPAGKWRVSNETVSAYTFNAFLGRQDLQGATMLNLPFALSRRALSAIGAGLLAKPVLALAMAVHNGHCIMAVPIVPARLSGGKRQDQALPDHQEEQIVMGDTLEAIHWLLRKQGIRGGFTDLGRRREKVRR
jgi:hypothetical protein